MADEQSSPRAMDLPPQSEAAQQGFFEQVLEQALAAERGVAACDVDIALVGRVIRLTFAGPILRDALLPALAHLQVDRREAVDAVFHIWESEVSGVPIIAAPPAGDCFTPTVAISGHS